MFKKTNRAGLLLGIVLLLPLGAEAQSAMVTDKDVQVAVRALGFAYGMPKGDIDIEIVYDPSNTLSLSEATQLSKMIGAGAQFANRTVHARMVTPAEMGTARVAYITHGLQGQYDLVMQKASAAKMLTFSTDFQCVGSQRCVMGVEAAPSIKIEISRAASAASALEFSQALKLMIHEVE